MDSYALLLNELFQFPWLRYQYDTTICIWYIHMYVSEKLPTIRYELCFFCFSFNTHFVPTWFSFLCTFHILLLFPFLLHLLSLFLCQLFLSFHLITACSSSSIWMQVRNCRFPEIKCSNRKRSASGALKDSPYAMIWAEKYYTEYLKQILKIIESKYSMCSKFLSHN